MKKFAALALALAAISAALAARPSEYELLKSLPPGRLAALTAADYPDAHGFTGGSRQQKMWIEAGMQRGGCRAFIGAIVAGDTARAEDAWRAVETAFAHQQADGGFDSAPRPDTGPLDGPTARVQSAFFFLQELGHAILVLRQSPLEAHFHARVAAIEPPLRRACAFMNAGYDTIIANSSQAVNRIIIAAKAFGLCGLALHDEALVATSRKLIAHALTLRDAEGVFIEKGGRDSSYNAVSILFGQVLALHVPLPEFESALAPAVAWQRTRILASGEVSVEGNTRTGVGKETYLGQPKGVNYTEMVLAFTYYGLAHDDRAALATADQVFVWARAHAGRH